MHLPVICRVTGVLLALFSIVMLVPAGIAFFEEDSTLYAFAAGFSITLISGLVLIGLGRTRQSMRSGDGFVVTVLFYAGLGLFGALPLYLYDGLGISFTDAAFESLSGLTTTGATVLTGLEALPASILFYRQLLQWLGGMGIIVLAVAILPMLGIGGMQLFRAETPGPVKDNKLTPRITATAKALWYLYVSITIACAAAYWFAGMSAFDAICHSFATVAIGGFSTYDASLGHFQSPAIEAVAILFMVIAGINFSLHFFAWNRRTPSLYWRDPELRCYLAILAGVAVIVCGVLASHPDSSESPIREGIFQTVSIATTTGFTTANFSAWPEAAPVLLLLSAFAGGCAASTAGGIKIIRVLLIYKQGLREIKRLIHPNGVFAVKVGTHRVSDTVINGVWGFFSAYVLLFMAMLVLLMVVTPLDFASAFSAVAASINNLGPGLGEVAQNYRALPDAGKWLLVIAMLLGRLEIFTLLVILTPAFWRR